MREHEPGKDQRWQRGGELRKGNVVTCKSKYTSIMCLFLFQSVHVYVNTHLHVLYVLIVNVNVRTYI